jgi:hypothetical protein
MTHTALTSRALSFSALACAGLLWGCGTSSTHVGTPVAFAADANTARFLANADFAQGEAAPAEWKLADGSSNLKLLRDTKEFSSAPAALRLETSGNGKGVAQSSLFRALPSGSFTIKGRYKLTGQWKNARLVVQSLDKSWGNVDWIEATNFAPGNDWQNFSREISFKPNATSALLHVTVEGSGALLLDDLRIETRDQPQINATADNKLIALQPTKYSGANLYNWNQVFVGGGGTVTALTTSKSEPGFVVAASDVGGPMIWNPKKKRWSHATDHFGPENTALYHAECVAIDPKNANVIYYSAGKEWQTGEPSILKTVDRGKTWKQIKLKTPEGKPVYISNGRTGQRLTIDPNNTRVLYYGSRRDGLFQSTDAGESWLPVENFPRAGHTKTNVMVAYILVDPNSGKAGQTSQTLWARVDKSNKDAADVEAGIYRSTDGGKTWQYMKDAPNVWNATLDSKGVFHGVGKGVHRYRDGKWEDITPADGKDANFFALAVSPANSNWIVAAHDKCGWDNNLFRTLDGGKTWRKYSDADYLGRGKKTMTGEIQPWEGGNNGAHILACASSLNFDRANPKKVWLTHWPGIIATEDITADVLHWRASVEGHEEICLFELVSLPKGAPLISGSMDIGGLRHTDLHKMPVSQMVGIKTPYNNAPEDVTDIDFCEADPNFVVVTGGWKYQDWNNDPKLGAMGYSTDNGVTWQNFPGRPFADARGGRISVAANDSNNIVFVPRDTLNGVNKGNTPVYFTKDRGKTWMAAKGAPLGMIFGEFVYTFYQPLESDRAKPNTFYLWDRRDGRFYRSGDGGENWAHVSTLPKQSGAHFNQHWLRAAPGMAGEVWLAADDQGLFRSSDGGDTWTKFDGVSKAWRFGWGLPLPGRKNPTAYMMGKIAGDDIKQTVALYRSDDMGATWVRLNEASQGWGQAITVNGDRQVAGRIYVGTNGRGIFYGVPAKASTRNVSTQKPSRN